MKKQALLILCAFVIAIGITGCGKKGKDKLADRDQNSINGEIGTDTVDTKGKSGGISTVDLETGSIISGKRSNGKADKTDKAVATEEDISAKGETGKNDAATSNKDL